ncbi:PAS domain S-box protein, partial [Tumidithrix elongata RA019]|nr:PAS domain S-box protein [Tumidithrix elongata RA019]
MISPAAVLNSPPIKVLLVEDDQIDRLAFTRSAKQASWPYDYTIATSLTEAISILSTQTFEIAILDYNLGDGLSSALFPILQNRNCPFIISTGSGDEETAAKLMNEGAYDYLIKDPDRNYLKILPATVNKTLDRHRAEGQLLLLNHAMQSVKDCIYILNEQGQLQFVNNTLAKLSNLTPQEAIGQPIQILKQPDLEEWLYSSNACPDFESSVEGQIPMRRADGTVYLAFISESCIQEASNPIRVGVIRDITSLKQIELELRNARENLEQIVLERTDALRQENQERLQAEANLLQLNQTLEARVETRTQELQDRESQLRDLFDNATDLIQSVAPDGRILFVNRAWKETLGYSDADLEQLSIFQVIHPDDLMHCQIVMQSLFNGSPCLGIETRFLTKDRQEIIVEGNVNCQFKDGIPIATRGIFRDITQRKLAEASLAESEAFNRQLVEEFPIGLVDYGVKMSTVKLPEPF